MDTLICNLFAGPGAGKSTVAAGVFAALKQEHVEAECIQEYAKDKSWQSDAFTLQCQPYITAKQLYRQHRVLGKVQVAVTDAPLLHGLIYPGHYTGRDFEKWLVSTFNQFNNLNILLERNVEQHGYSEVGRSQTLAEAEEIDKVTLAILHAHKIPFRRVLVDELAVSRIVHIINEVRATVLA